MYCLNCGNHVEVNEGNCSYCNIDIARHGSFSKPIIPNKINEITGENIKKAKNSCPNCLGELRDEDQTKCYRCNYNLINDSSGSGSSSAKSEDKSGNSPKLKVDFPIKYKPN